MGQGDARVEDRRALESLVATRLGVDVDFAWWDGEALRVRALLLQLDDGHSFVLGFVRDAVLSENDKGGIILLVPLFDLKKDQVSWTDRQRRRGYLAAHDRVGGSLGPEVLPYGVSRAHSLGR